MEEVLNLGLDDNEVKEILDEHGNRINRLEIDNASIKEKLNSISLQMGDTKEQVTDLKDAVARLETTVLTTNNSILSTLSQVVTNTNNNSTQIITTEKNNKKDIIIKILGIIGACVTGYLAAKFGLNVTV